jgi:AraC-like DNA-binding protein
MPARLGFAEYRPTGRLASYVRAFQLLSTEGSAPVSVLDFGGADVSIPLRFGDPVLVEGSQPKGVPSAALVGPRTRSVWLRFHGRIDQVNVSFFPGVAGSFVSLSMPEIVDRVASPDDVWPRDFREAVADLEQLPIEERIPKLSDLLLAQLVPAREPGPQLRGAVRLIYERRGRVRVQSLADDVNLSVSQLERGFKHHVGVGPKLMARQTRVSALAAAAMGAANPDWTRLADRYGFSDQAHLTREFHELIGLTPAAFGGIRPDADFLQDAFACPPRD